MAGKGDKLRPINKKKFDKNFEAIFKHKKKKKGGGIKIFKKTY